MIGNDWIPFHRRLAKGPKKSIPRGVRFVLLELSLEARATRGVIDLPLDWATLDAVHDLIGGDRNEIKRALETFTKTDDTGVSPIEIRKTSAVHRLIVTKWEDWAGPKSSAERVAEHRRRKKNETLDRPVTLPPVTPSNGRNRLQDSTVHNRTESAATLHPSPSTPPPADESGFDLAWRVWSEAWQARHREPYRRSVDTGRNGDDRILQRLGALALEHGADNAERVLRRKLALYLATSSPWLIRNRHPLRVFEKDWNNFGDAAPPEPIDDSDDDADTAAPLTSEQTAELLRKKHDEQAAKSKAKREDRKRIADELERNLAALRGKA